MFVDRWHRQASGKLALTTLALFAPQAFAGDGIPCTGASPCRDGSAVPVASFEDEVLTPGAWGKFSLAIPRYDGSSGPLAGIELEFELEVTGELCFLNETPQNCALSTWVAFANFEDLSSLDAPLCDAFPLDRNFEVGGFLENIPPGSEECAQIGPFGACGSCLREGPIQIGPLTDPFNLAAFSGAGLVEFTGSLESYLGSNTCLSIETTILFDMRAKLRVTYLACGMRNLPPICPDGASVELWPPNHHYVDLDLALVAGVVDPNGLPLAIVITGITQDEPIDGPGDGNTMCDGRGVGTNVASIRAERAGGGDGRVYHVSYDATNSAGESCSGVFRVTVPHSQDGAPAEDGGPSVDSTQGC